MSIILDNTAVELLHEHTQAACREGDFFHVMDTRRRLHLPDADVMNVRIPYIVMALC